MDINEARNIWGDTMDEKDLVEWVQVYNRRKANSYVTYKGETVLIESDTGEETM